MKTENTPDNESKFRALYFGVICVLTVGVRGKIHNNIPLRKINPHLLQVTGNKSAPVAKFTLQLKSLSQISDEDAIEVAKLICKRHNRHFKDGEVTYEYVNGKNTVIVIVKGVKRYKIHIGYDGCSFMDWYMGGAGDRDYYCPGQYAATDYLRSKGYLIGWRDLTAEDILSYGWVKLEGQG